MEPIFIIHPADSNLKFFNKSIKELQQHFPANYLHLGPDDIYHQGALQELKNHTEATVIFFCHGLEGSLRGCNRESAQRRPYNHGNFISANKDLDVLRGKRVFCMACDSNSLGNLAVGVNAKAFLGFGLIRFNTSKRKNKRVSDLAKFTIRKIVETALIKAYRQNFTFNQLSLELRNLIVKDVNLLTHGNGHPDIYVRRQLVVLLMTMKREIIMFGNGFEHVFIKD